MPRNNTLPTGNLAMMTALVSHHVSKPAEYNGIDFFEVMSDSAKRSQAQRDLANPDKRNIVRGSNIQIWAYELLQDMQHEWDAIMREFNLYSEYAFILKKPKKLLIIDTMFTFSMLPKHRYPETEITFLNGVGLAEYELNMDLWVDENGKNIRDFDYSVVDYEDLETEKFDAVFTSGWSIASNPKLLSLCANALEPEGMLLLAGTNQSAKIYRGNWFATPYSDLHEYLKTLDGLLYHISAGYGLTIFINEPARVS